MRARAFVFQPEELSLLYKAFDDAWEVVKAHHNDTPESREVGRLRLANGVIAAYRGGVTDQLALTAAAIEWMHRRS
jgi:hypothetical protein